MDQELFLTKLFIKAVNQIPGKKLTVNHQETVSGFLLLRSDNDVDGTTTYEVVDTRTPRGEE
jgi:hypothetical protein